MKLTETPLSRCFPHTFQGFTACGVLQEELSSSSARDIEIGESEKIKTYGVFICSNKSLYPTRARRSACLRSRSAHEEYIYPRKAVKTLAGVTVQVREHLAGVTRKARRETSRHFGIGQG